MNTVKAIPSYAEGLTELQQNLENMLPTQVLEVFSKDAAKLEKKHASILKLTEGETAPNFTLSNALGESINLSSLLKKGKVVLTFYRGTWCPYCNLQLNQYQQALEEIHALGAELVGVSPQTPDESLSMQEKNNLQFQVLSDNGNLVTRKFTTVFKNGHEPIEAMKSLGIDFSAHYADDSNEIPVPAVFIIEQDGKISFAKTNGGDYRSRIEVQEILDALKN
ncbi:MAG: peroxiredoxin-like family protein [Luteibaculum sp.]